MIEKLFLVLFLVSLVALFFGLIKPSIVKMNSRKKVLIVFFSTTLLFFFLWGMTVPPLTPEEKRIMQEKQAAEQARAEQEKQNKQVAEQTKINKQMEEKNKQTEQIKDLINVISFSGNQAVKSKEFTITSKEIKFVYSCNEGPFVCVAWLYQIGGEKQELFRSSGNASNFSEQKTLSIGPGTFYIEMDTRDREYKIDVFQSSMSASTEETNSVQAKIDNSKKYRDMNGFKLTNEDMLVGEILYYNYETNDGIYSVALTVYPNNTSSKLEDEFTLTAGSLKINNTVVQYAFDEGYKLNGAQIIKPYESAEFIFVANSKTHIGFVEKINNESDQTGIETTLKSFVSALVPSI